MIPSHTITPYHTLSHQVEAKRAVPRSEVSRDTGGPSKLGPAPSKPQGSGTGGPGSTNGLASPSQTQIQNESRHALDARINMDEYAYNKIFVGGLHYDTRDGKNELQLFVFFLASSGVLTCCT